MDVNPKELLPLTRIQQHLSKVKSLRHVAEVTGLSYNTVQRFAHNPDINPTAEVWKLMSDYVRGDK